MKQIHDHDGQQAGNRQHHRQVPINRNFIGQPFQPDPAGQDQGNLNGQLINQDKIQMF